MKTEKRQKLFSRRAHALRRVLAAAVVLFLVNEILGVGLLLPIQAIRRSEERMGTGRTAVVCRERAPEIYKSLLLYLTENESVTMLSGAHLSLYGWSEAFGVAVDCTEEAPIHGGWWNMSRREGANLFWVFGRVDDPNIARVEAVVEHETWEGDELVRRKALTWSSSRKVWLEKYGRYYFLLRSRPLDWSSVPAPIYQEVIGYDEEGGEVARVSLDQWTSTIFA